MHKSNSKYSRFATANVDKPGPGSYDTSAMSMYSQITKSKKRLGISHSKNALGSGKRLTYFKSKSISPGPG